MKTNEQSINAVEAALVAAFGPRVEMVVPEVKRVDNYSFMGEEVHAVPSVPVLETPRGFVKGAEVQVVKGRKTPIGTVGRIFWIGDDRFRSKGKCFGLETSTGQRFFISDANCKAL
jgi:hypothetical protein